MTTQTIFQLSAITEEIRKTNNKYEAFHDDWICLAEWCSDISTCVGVDKINWEEIGEIGPRAKIFLEDAYEKRKKLLEKYVPEAQTAFEELKARVITLLVEDEELKKCSSIASEGLLNMLSMIKDVESLRVAINMYYKLKSEIDKGAHCKRLGEIAFIGIKALVSNVPIPDEIFSEDTIFVKQPLQAFVGLFVAVNESTRKDLIAHFGKMMKGLIACFALYRLPIHIAVNQKPVYPSRFIPSVSLKPFLDEFGLKLGTFAVSP